MDENANHDGKTLNPQVLFRYRLVGEVLAYESRGMVRHAAVETVADVRHQDGEGRTKRVSTRTLYRWVRAFEEKGVFGLCRASPKRVVTNHIPEDLAAFLVAEKEADPAASIPELIRRAQQEKLPGALNVSRTTVWRRLRSCGLDTKRLKTKKQRAMRRFTFAHRMEMVLCDGKHFRAGPQRAKRVVLFYLDDATRLALGAVVGPSENHYLFLWGLHRCLRRHGLMQCLFTDNGSAFIADDCKSVLANLGIHYIQGTPGHPQARGKVERFNRTAFEDLLRHLDRAEHIDPDCAALELRINHYLTHVYNVRAHGSLDGMSPQERFNTDVKPLKFATTRQLDSCFRLPLTRRVSPDQIVSVDGVAYDMPEGYAKQKVGLSRDLINDCIDFIHQGRIVTLHPHDAQGHARRPPKRHAAPTDPQPRATTRGSATMNFNQQFQALVDDEGNYHDKESSDDQLS